MYIARRVKFIASITTTVDRLLASSVAEHRQYNTLLIKSYLAERSLTLIYNSDYL